MAFYSKRGHNNYYQHDDRGSGTRHVSFKAGSSSKGKVSRQRGWDQKVRKYMENEDVDMSVTMKNNKNLGRFNPMKGRGGRVGRFMERKTLSESPSNWYKVTVCYGKKYARQEIMKAIQTFIQPVPFTPIAVRMDDDDMVFFIDNYKTAHSIYTSHMKIQLRDGWKMQIKVVPHMPCVELNADLKEKIKIAMSTKYDTRTQHLDLSKFHANEDFLKSDLFVPLNRTNMLLAVFQIIAESVPNLRSLNLSENKIFSTEHFSMLKKSANDLKVLDLSKNKISDLGKLSCLNGMKIETLVLDENPLCDKYQDQTTYVREVRKIFRSLLVLDGVELPPPVSFDIEEKEHRLPQSQGNFLCNVDGREFTRQFLEQFFAMYDNQVNRDSVADAYAENAQFSMTAFTGQSGTNLNRYITESRNLKKVFNFERRAKLLHTGKQEIVRFLNQLPKTQHDFPSFTVDLTVFKPDYVISLCVNGVFRETDANLEHKASYVKAFSRTFILISAGAGGGFNIINDMLFVTNASEHQLSTSFQPQPSTSVETSPPPLNAVNVASPPVNTVDVKLQEMVATLAMQTGMNFMWAEKCLMETNWDFNNALYAFTEFNKMGEIPPEAFNK